MLEVICKVGTAFPIFLLFEPSGMATLYNKRHKPTESMTIEQQLKWVIPTYMQNYIFHQYEIILNPKLTLTLSSIAGIHIGEPVGRYLPQHHLDMDIKVEVDGPYGLEGLSASGGMGPGPLGPGGVPSPGPGPGPGRTRKNKEDKVCGVCGDRALGYNFDAISCESCKAFFRRNAPKGLVSRSVDGT